MRKTISAFICIVSISFLVAGCAGPEQKLGRGVNNMTEIVRGGEIRRSIEQTAVFSSNRDSAYGRGIIHGFDRTMSRTFTGVYEVLTFPIPNHPNHDYSPVFYPVAPVYPDSYKPGWFADTIVSPDTALGFSSGDVAPFVPGSRFHIFDD